VKKVYCLYRVSSKAQVDYSNASETNEGDIPMQEQACRVFAARQDGWEIVSEITELGVSGFKKSAKGRDAIQEIQKAAVEKKFDVLLVFMFDRLGRREDETPFILQWFVEQGVEVWSVNEGQQRFDSHTDKLLNYIRFWQASGESIKIAARTKAGIAQTANQGLYYGGKVPYGYRLVKKGRTNKKGYEIYDLEIDPFAATHIKIIFERYVYNGMGYLRLKHSLYDDGIRDTEGNKITDTVIRNILGNKLLIGIMECGDVCTAVPEMRILEDDSLFYQAEKIKHERANEQKSKRKTPLNTRGKALLAGNVFCDCCGGRLTTSVAGAPYTRKDGTINENKNFRYVCTNKARKVRDCDGQSTYSMKKLDSLVSELLDSLFQNIKGASESKLIEKSYQKEVEGCKARLKASRAELKKQTDSLKTLQGEVVKAIEGTSKFDSELLNDLITQAKEKIATATEEVSRYEAELENGQQHLSAIKTDYQRLISWAEMFQSSNIETKKMIVAYLIDNVKVNRGYELDIQFNVAFEQFFNAG